MRYPGFKITPLWVLIGINFVFFIVIIAVPDLFYFLGLQPALVLHQPWTVITCLFVHAGLWHLLANTFTLFFFGGYLARLVGWSRMLAVYFGGGLLGSILFVLLAPPSALGVGASGAVFALGGVLAVMRPKLRVFIFPIPLPIPLWIAVIGGFLILSFIPYIAWQAHLGGLIVGLIAGYFFRRRERHFFWS